MIKLLGAILIFFACFSAAKSKAEEKIRAHKALVSLSDCLKRAAEEISFSLSTLPKITENLSRAENDVFFRSVLKNIKNSAVTMAEAWKNAAEENKKILGGEAAETLKILSCSIGRFSAETETQNIMKAKEQIDAVCEKKEEELKKTVKLIKSMGVIAAALLIILFV